MGKGSSDQTITPPRAFIGGGDVMKKVLKVISTFMHISNYKTQDVYLKPTFPWCILDKNIVNICLIISNMLDVTKTNMI